MESIKSLVSLYLLMSVPTWGETFPYKDIVPLSVIYICSQTVPYFIGRFRWLRRILFSETTHLEAEQMCSFFTEYGSLNYTVSQSCTGFTIVVGELA